MTSPQTLATLANDTLSASGLDATLDQAGRSVGETALGETMAATVPDAAPARTAATAPGRQTTVLPKIEDRGGQMVLIPRHDPRYASERVLGEGGMGIVELARDEDIGRPVAIKRLRAERGDPLSLARFAEEVRTVGRLDHPGIAPIHDVGLDGDGSFFFVMKYVRGETLEEVIERLAAGDPKAHAEYTFERRTDVFLAVLHALDYAHAAGLLHRDIKPANVMIGEYGEVLLMDWGIARPIGAGAERTTEVDAGAEEPEQDTAAVNARLVSTRHGAIIGTPLYMSPEQAMGQTTTLDARSDVFAAGMLFAELLALSHPLEAHRTVPAIVHALQTEDPPAPWDERWLHETQNPVPSELRHFVRKATQRDPEERFQSVGEMILELGRIRAGEFKIQCPATFMKKINGRTLRLVDRYPIGVNLAVLLLASTFVTALTGFVYLLATG